MRQFIVIGLGRFGRSLARALAEAGHEVLGVDLKEHRAHELAGILTHTVQADGTDEDVLVSLGVRNFDVAVVGIGEDIHASLLITLLLKQHGVRYVVAKAQSSLHGRVLERIGADRVVYPERDMGARVAHNLMAEDILDYIELSPDVSMVEVVAHGKLADKTLRQLELRARYGVNVVAVKHGDRVATAPKADEVVHEGDILLVIGGNEGIRKLEAGRG